MRTAVVLVGGDPVDPALRARLPADAVVVAADSGLHNAAPLGLHVDLIVGDFDSADPVAVAGAVAAGARLEHHPAAKDATDLELAIDRAVRDGAQRVIVVGGAGGRLDHFLGNVLLLAAPAFATLAIEAFVGAAHLHVARGGGPAVELHGRAGSLVTLLPAGGTAYGIVTRGLQYPLEHEDLDAGTTRGISNVLVDTDGGVTLERGTLLVIQPDAGTGEVS